MTEQLRQLTFVDVLDDCEGVQPMIPGSAHDEAAAWFKTAGLAYQRAIRDIEARNEPRVVLQNLDGCSVQRISTPEARRLILRYEWLRTMGRAVACYGLRGPDGVLLGATCFGWPAGIESRDICGREHRGTAICLERGACVHWAPSNAASFLIRHAVRLAHRDYGWEIFYAYADEDAGEIGTVYQASNWKYIGQGVGRTPGRFREDFRAPDGKILSSRTLRHRGLTKKQVLADGWEVVCRPPKHKYVWFEGRRHRFLERSCRYPFLPYPKREHGRLAA